MDISPAELASIADAVDRAGFYRLPDRDRIEVEYYPVDWLVHDPVEAYRIFYARSEQASPELLRRLAFDTSDEVRLAVAKHPKSLPQALREAAGDASSAVRLAVASHANTPADLLINLARDTCLEVQIAVINRPDLSSEVLTRICEEYPARMDLPTQSDDNASKKFYEGIERYNENQADWQSGVYSLVFCEASDIPMMVAKNPVTPAAVLEMLVNDKGTVYQDRLAEAGVEPSTIKKILYFYRFRLKRLIYQHPNATEAHKKQALRHPRVAQELGIVPPTPISWYTLAKRLVVVSVVLLVCTFFSGSKVWDRWMSSASLNAVALTQHIPERMTGALELGSAGICSVYVEVPSLTSGEKPIKLTILNHVNQTVYSERTTISYSKSTEQTEEGVTTRVSGSKSETFLVRLPAGRYRVLVTSRDTYHKRSIHVVVKKHVILARYFILLFLVSGILVIFMYFKTDEKSQANLPEYDYEEK